MAEKRPRDINQLAKAITDEATDPQEPQEESEAAKLGRRGGQKGGKARAQSLTAEERSEIARRAAEARWSSESKSGGGEES